MERFKFTKRRLEALPVPTERVRYAYDADVRGLRVGIHPSGRRTFSLYRKFRRQPTTVPLGEFPHVSVDQARAHAAEKIALIARGVDPRVKPEAPALTLGGFFERYVAEHLANRPVAQRSARRTFDRYVARWRNRALDGVTRADVERLHREVAQPIVESGKRQRQGPVAANRLLALISGIYTKARDWGIYERDNPARGVKRVAEHARRRLLERDGELARFRAALDAERDADLRLYLKLRLYNGVREHNILRMRWTDVDVTRGTWQLGQTKTGDPLLVPLASPVVRELEIRARRSEWVFVGRRRGHALTTLNRRWRAFRAALNLDDVQLRDLRRTFGSRALASGVPMDVIAQAMGHRPGSKITASVYALADEHLKRGAVDLTAKQIRSERAPKALEQRNGSR